MRVAVVADVHGNFDALARAADGADRLVILGDLLDYVDYHDPSRGILGEIFGADRVHTFTQLRLAGAFADLHRYNAQLWASLADPVAVLAAAVQERYRRVCEVVPADTLLTLGNVDVAAEWDRATGGTLPYHDADVVEIDGTRWGFVAGGVSRHSSPAAIDSRPTAERPWRPFIRSGPAFEQAVAALGPVDVLCSHIPPDLPLLRYDVIPGRLEMSGPGLARHIDTHSPRLSLYGHVHQPLTSRARRGMTECVNVGHFQRTERPVIVDTDTLRAA